MTCSLALSFLLVGAACGGPPGAQAVDLTIDSDPCLGLAAESIEVIVRDRDGVETDRLMAAGDDLSFPTGVRVVAASADSDRFEVEATLFGPGNLPIARLRFEGNFPESGLVTERVLFDDSCHGHICTHGACSEGRCVPIDQVPRREATSLPSSCPGHAFVDPERTGDCASPESPCASIDEALSYLGARGGILELHGDRTFPPFELGADRVVVRAWPGTGRPVVDAAGADNGIRTRGADIALDGLEVFGAAFHGIHVNGSENVRVTVRRCLVHDCGFVEPPIDRNSNAGVQLNNNVSDVVVEECEIRSNRLDSAEFGAWGLHVNTSTGALIRNNDIYDNTTAGIHAIACEGMRVEGNRIHENGVGLSGRCPLTAENNLICSNQGRGVVVADPITLRRNTVIRSGVDAVFVEAGEEATVEQNILAFSGGSGLAAAAGARVRDRRNLYFQNAVGDQSGYEPAEPTTDLMADPLFVEPETCSAAVAAESPANGAADSLVVGAR